MSEGRREHESSQSLLDSNTSWKVWKRGRGHTPKMEKQPKMNAWQPGFLRRIPWGGISCLFGVLCCIVVNIAILATSNGAPITSWKYPPSLYLSVAYTLGNILLSAAFSQGLTVCPRDYLLMCRPLTRDPDLLVAQSFEGRHPAG